MKVVRVNVRCGKYEHMNLRSRHLDLLSGGQIVAQSSSLSWRRPPLCITCEQSKQRLIPSCMPAIESKSTTRVRAARTRTVLSARCFPMLRPRTKPPIDWVRFFAIRMLMPLLKPLLMSMSMFQNEISRMPGSSDGGFCERGLLLPVIIDSHSTIV